MAAELEQTEVLRETLHGLYRTKNAERAALGFRHYLESGDLDHPGVLYTFARIAMVSAADLLQQGMEIPAIIYASSAMIPSNDFSGLARALKRLAAKVESGEADPSGGLFRGAL